MHRSDSHQAAHTSARPASQVLTVCVVDPNADDYPEWVTLAQASGLRLTILASADEALRLSRTAVVDLWVINTRLPGLSGFELCGMLKHQRHRAAVYLVADEYSPAAEQAAWQSRATLFGCKGAHAAWLSDWLQLKSCGPLTDGNSESCRAISSAA